MKNLVLFKEVCQFEGKLIVQEVAAEIYLGERDVDTDLVEDELSGARLQCVVR